MLICRWVWRSDVLTSRCTVNKKSLITFDICSHLWRENLRKSCLIVYIHIYWILMARPILVIFGEEITCSRYICGRIILFILEKLDVKLILKPIHKTSVYSYFFYQKIYSSKCTNQLRTLLQTKKCKILAIFITNSCHLCTRLPISTQ